MYMGLGWQQGPLDHGTRHAAWSYENAWDLTIDEMSRGKQP
jgi:hypothetical protein